MKGGAGQVFASNQQLQGCLVIFPDFKIGGGHKIIMFDCILVLKTPYVGYCGVNLNFFI